MVGEVGPVGGAFLEEAVAALGGFVGAVGEACGLTGEHLLADESVVDQSERDLQHSLRGGALGADLPPPLQRSLLQFGVGDRGVDCAHPVHVVG